MKTANSGKRGRPALVVFMLVAFASPAGLSAATTEGGAADRMAAEEADGLALQALAESTGALGVYLETKSGERVVVVPSSGKSSFAAKDVLGLSLSVRVETRDIDRVTIERISEALEAMKPAIKGHSYGFGFDPETGTMILKSEAPESAFAAVQEAFPGKITFRAATFDMTARCSDTAPYSGGACLNGSLSCTSGFALDFNAGGRYMVTAGHCNPNGTTTNMGTAWRESAAYPYWDFELIKGKTYRPYVYDSGSYTRPVVNASNPSVGTKYCTSGRTTGTVCGLTARKINQTICFTDYPGCAHNLVELYNSAEFFVQPGDSGGPVYYSYSSPNRAGIRGVISGRSWDLFQGWSSYATQYQSIASYYVAHAALAN